MNSDLKHYFALSLAVLVGSQISGYVDREILGVAETKEAVEKYDKMMDVYYPTFSPDRQMPRQIPWHVIPQVPQIPRYYAPYYYDRDPAPPAPVDPSKLTPPCDDDEEYNKTMPSA